MNRTPALEGMSRRGVPIFFVDPHGIAGIYRAISSIGHVLNRDREAANLVADLHAREQRTRARAQGKVPVRIFLPVWYDPITTIGRRAFITELIEAAGASSITSDIAQEWPQVSLESVVARHPEALVLIRGSQISPEMLSSRPGWAQLPAIQKHHIYFVDEHIQLPGPSAIHAMEALSKEFYP